MNTDNYDRLGEPPRWFLPLVAVGVAAGLFAGLLSTDPSAGGVQSEPAVQLVADPDPPLYTVWATNDLEPLVVRLRTNSLLVIDGEVLLGPTNRLVITNCTGREVSVRFTPTLSGWLWPTTNWKCSFTVR